ncbi:chemotaxis protein CheW [uncultured Aquabacterium sp.]|uniref:chemotaxis protein CheW n=1 Tax=Aquabacterium sp. TaxID=1872578 RepID=UPI0025D8E5BB|nr:chemotaxis protein CheW [uncultured Aquabacterium sp.]
MANKEALRQLQQRLADRLQRVREQAPTRNWLAVEIAAHGFLLPLDQAGEIFPVAAIQAVPHSQPWFLGVANLRGHLHGVADLGRFLGLRDRAPRTGSDVPARDAGRLVAFNQGLQLNACLLIDRLLGLRQPDALQPAEGGEAAPHFVVRALADAQGRVWYELDLAALAADEAFLKIDA